MKKLQVPYNGELEVLEVYKNWSNFIYEIYFPLHPSIFPSARQKDFPPIKEYNDQLKLICTEMNLYGIKSMVILNGIKINYSNNQLRLIEENIAQLIPFGLHGLVIADPILAAKMHEYFPSLNIRLSVLSNIHNLEKIKQIESLGYIKEICLPQNLNRNEDKLKELKEKTNLKYSTIVNSLCRINCPLFYWHQNLYSSNTTDWKDVNEISEIKDTFCDLIHNFTSNPLKAPFIFPNELNYYDSYFDYFKLEDRTLPTFRLANIIKYYSLRVNPKKLNSCISGSCIYLKDSVSCNYPEEWIQYRRNCKGYCSECSYCDTIYKEE